MMRLGLKNKVIIYFALVIVIAVMATGLLSIAESESRVKHTSELNFLFLAREIHFNINNVFAQGFNTLHIMSEDETLTSESSTREELNIELLKYHEAYPVFEDIMIFDTEANLVSAAKYQYQGSWRYSSLLAGALNGSSSASNVHFIDNPLRAVVSFAGPLLRDGEVIGSAVIQLNAEEIHKISDHVSIGDSGFSFVIDENYNIVAHPDKELLLEPVDDHLRQQLESQSDSVSFYYHGDMYIGARHSAEMSPGRVWTVVVAQKEDELLEPINKMIKDLIGLFFSLFAATMIIGVLMSDSIVRPILMIKKTTDKIARNDFSESLNVRTGDELESLANSVNEMSADLKKSHEKLEHYAKSLEEQVADRTRQLDEQVVKLTERDRQITEINSRLEKANDKLKHLDKQKDEFISIAAHELKTPLTSIKGFAQLMQNQAVSEDRDKRNHYLDLINKNTERLYNLILDIVDSSRISLGQLKIIMGQVDCNKVLSEIRDTMEMTIRSKGVEAVFEIDPSTPVAYGDFERVGQVLRNLIINAVHYTEKGSITVRISPKDGGVVFEVSDTGQGIPEEAQQNLFSRFYQVDSSMTRKVGGSGLGLSVCKGLVELMHGKIWLHSEFGKGTTFYFRLPAYTGQESPPNPEEKPATDAAPAAQAPAAPVAPAQKPEASNEKPAEPAPPQAAQEKAPEGSQQPPTGSQG